MHLILLDGNLDYRGGGALLGLWAHLLLLSVVLEADGFPAGVRGMNAQRDANCGKERLGRPPGYGHGADATATMTDGRYPTARAPDSFEIQGRQERGTPPPGYLETWQPNSRHRQTRSCRAGSVRRGTHSETKTKAQDAVFCKIAKRTPSAVDAGKPWKKRINSAWRARGLGPRQPPIRDGISWACGRPSQASTRGGN